MAGRLQETDQRITSLKRGLNSVAFLAPTADGSEPIPLSKTFLFWVPSFTDPTLSSREWKAAEIKFHEWLSRNPRKDGFIRFRCPKISLTYQRML